MTEKLEPMVEKIDRDAAWPFRPEGYGPIDKEAWDSGLCDHNRFIQAFARHRASSHGPILEALEELPWSDLKVAFDWNPPATDDYDDFLGLGLLMQQAWPEGWEINKVDGAGARCVAVFRVDGMPSLAAGQAVEAQLRALALSKGRVSG